MVSTGKDTLKVSPKRSRTVSVHCPLVANTKIYVKQLLRLLDSLSAVFDCTFERKL